MRCIAGALWNVLQRLTIEGESVNTAQVQSDLNRLSAEVAGEHSSILVDISEDSEVVCARSLKKGKGKETFIHNHPFYRFIRARP